MGKKMAMTKSMEGRGKLRETLTLQRALFKELHGRKYKPVTAANSKGYGRGMDRGEKNKINTIGDAR
jgi:hypothetical protein